MTRIICGVDVGSEMLDAQVGRNGAWQRFAQVMGCLEKTDRIDCGKIAEAIDDDPLWAELNCAFRPIKGAADRTLRSRWPACPRSGC